MLLCAGLILSLNDVVVEQAFVVLLMFESTCKHVILLMFASHNSNNQQKAKQGFVPCRTMGSGNGKHMCTWGWGPASIEIEAGLSLIHI